MNSCYLTVHVQSIHINASKVYSISSIINSMKYIYSLTKSYSFIKLSAEGCVSSIQTFVKVQQITGISF